MTCIRYSYRQRVVHEGRFGHRLIDVPDSGECLLNGAACKGTNTACPDYIEKPDPAIYRMTSTQRFFAQRDRESR